MPTRAPGWTDLAPGVRVRQSRAFHMNSALLLAREQAVVIDPGVLPAELDELAAATAEANPLRVAIVFTHAHWDHVLGRTWWPGARTFAHDRFATELVRDAQTIRAEAERLAIARGERWGHPFAPFRPDEPVSGLRFLKLEPWRLVLRDAPGHCPSALTLHVPELRLLFAGDLLSDLEIPGLDGPPEVYRSTLETLVPLIEGGAIETLVPGHGAIALGRDAVHDRLRADLDYLDRLECLVNEAIADGATLEQTEAKLAAMAIVGREDPEYPTGPVHEQNIQHAYRSAAAAFTARRERR